MCSTILLHLASAQSWVSTNKLKLNPDKTEFLLIGEEWQRSKYSSMFLIEPSGVKTYPARSARNRGVIFDKKLLITGINFCLGLQKLTLPSSNVF